MTRISHGKISIGTIMLTTTIRTTTETRRTRTRTATMNNKAIQTIRSRIAYVYTIINNNNNNNNEDCFNRHTSYDHHGSKRRELAQHAHSRGSHAFTHTRRYTPTQLQPRCAKRQLSYYIIWTPIFILNVPEGGGANRSARRNPSTACPLIGIT